MSDLRFPTVDLPRVQEGRRPPVQGAGGHHMLEFSLGGLCHVVLLIGSAGAGSKSLDMQCVTSPSQPLQLHTDLDLSLLFL